MENKVEVLVAEFSCQTCSQKVRARVPAMQISNHTNVSALIFTHEQGTRCSGCDSYYLPVLTGITKELQLKLTWKKISTQKIEKSSKEPAAVGVQ